MLSEIIIKYEVTEIKGCHDDYNKDMMLECHSNINKLSSV